MSTMRLLKVRDDGTIDPEAIPGGVGGGPQDVAFQFGGTLAVQSGAFFWLSPSEPIRILRATITLGVLGSGGTVTAAVIVNGAAVGSVSVSGATRLGSSTTFSPDEIPANQLVSIDITAAGAGSPGNAVVQLLWEYA